MTREESDEVRVRGEVREESDEVRVSEVRLCFEFHVF